MRPWIFAALLGLVIANISLGQEYDARIYIPVKVNDQPLNFIFDTGASDVAIFRHTAEALNLKLTSPPTDVVLPAGQIPISRSEPIKLTIFDSDFEDLHLPVVDNPPGPLINLDGVIGWPILRNNQILFKGDTLHFEIGPDQPSQTRQWLKLREKYDHAVLSLELPTNKFPQVHPSYLGIDSGADHGIRLAPELWKKWRAKNSRSPFTLTAYFMPLAGIVTSEVGWAKKINLHGLEFKGVPVGPMNRAEQQVYPSGTIAVIGIQALRRLDIFFDGKNHEAYIHPADTPPPVYRHNMIGAVFSPTDVNSDLLIAHVIKGSPAYSAGVREGDILLKIGDLDVTPWRITPGILPFSRFFTQAPGTVIKLTLKRGEKTLVTHVTQRTILGPTQTKP